MKTCVITCNFNFTLNFVVIAVIFIFEVMGQTRIILICSVFFFLFLQTAQAKKMRPGYIVLENNDTLFGMLQYRLIDVPSRMVFVDHSNGEKTIYGPNELLGFTYQDETWRTIEFSKSEIGWQESFFVKVKMQNGSIELMRGKISSESCQCSGTHAKVRYQWLLYNAATQEKMLITKGPFGKIEKPEWVAAFFSSCGYSFGPNDFANMSSLKKRMELLNA